MRLGDYRPNVVGADRKERGVGGEGGEGGGVRGSLAQNFLARGGKHNSYHKH